MSVTVRPYVNGGWEVDIRIQLPDGSVIRERKKAAASSKQAAQKWAESRERVLLVHGKPKPAKEDVQKIATLKEFALRFLDGYAKANRLMRGAPARAIQELAGHQDLGTTQRYMHLSPAAPTRRSDYWRPAPKRAAWPWRNSGGGGNGGVKELDSHYGWLANRSALSD